MAATIMKRAISLVSSRQTSYEYRRHLSQIVNPNGTTRASTLAAVKHLETQGVPSNQAEAITSGVTNVRSGSLESKDLPQARLPRISDEFRASAAASHAVITKEVHKCKAQLRKTRYVLLKCYLAYVAALAICGAAIVKFNPKE